MRDLGEFIRHIDAAVLLVERRQDDVGDESEYILAVCGVVLGGLRGDRDD
jgi:hypothetical protein